MPKLATLSLDTPMTTVRYWKERESIDKVVLKVDNNHCHFIFNRGFTYYKMNNLDNRISNADQLLTQDVEKFCDSVVELYSNISKPILDILIYVQKLTQAIGGQVSSDFVCVGIRVRACVGEDGYVHGNAYIWLCYLVTSSFPFLKYFPLS